MQREMALKVSYRGLTDEIAGLIWLVNYGSTGPARDPLTENVWWGAKQSRLVASGAKPQPASLGSCKDRIKRESFRDDRQILGEIFWPIREPDVTKSQPQLLAQFWHPPLAQSEVCYPCF